MGWFAGSAGRLSRAVVGSHKGVACVSLEWQCGGNKGRSGSM